MSDSSIREEPIYLFVTGGTFDKEYNMITGELYFKDTHVNEMLQRGRCTTNVTVRTLMMVDSLEMTDSDRALIIHNCKKVDSNRIILTHGTDRMVYTAKALAEQNIEGKTIVLTGAMIPYKFGNSSDGFFNLGFAIALVQSLKPGVYIAMNGRIFQWDNVVKNKTTGFFEKLN
jgi:L-asparaginase